MPRMSMNHPHNSITYLCFFQRDMSWINNSTSDKKDYRFNSCSRTRRIAYSTHIPKPKTALILWKIRSRHPLSVFSTTVAFPYLPTPYPEKTRSRENLFILLTHYTIIYSWQLHLYNAEHALESTLPSTINSIEILQRKCTNSEKC